MAGQENDDATLSRSDPTAGRSLLGAEVYALIATPARVVDGSEIEQAQPRFEDVVPLHLDWIGALEESGVLVLAGPLTSGPGTGPGSGIIVIRAESESAAATIARQDPLVEAGLRSSTVHRWRINEGSLRIRLVLSRSSVEWG